MAYSVSPFLRRAISGGKNRLKRSTRMPTALAAKKWPASWRMISTAKAEEGENPAHARTPISSSGQLSRLGIRHVERLEVVDPVGAELIQDAFDHRGNPHEVRAGR